MSRYPWTAAVALTVPLPAFASSHREAPNISRLPDIKTKCRILAAACMAAAFLAACNSGNNSGSNSPPAPPPQTTAFSTFAEQTFAVSANATPTSLDGVNFTFDVNNDPTAFDALITAGMF
jgi:hypothetical protein